MLYPELQCDFDVFALMNVYYIACRLVDPQDQLGMRAQKKMMEHFN